MGKPKLLILEGHRGPRITAFCDGPAVNEAFDVTRSGELTGTPDLVYCQTYGQRNSFEQLASWGGPYVIHVGGDIWNERRERKRVDALSEVVRVMSRAQRVVCVSEFLAGVVRGNIGTVKGEVGSKNVVGLPGGLWGTDHTERGIVLDRFRPKSDYSIKGRPLVVMNINLTVQRKWRGVPMFMEAVHGTFKEHDVLAICVGKVKGKDVMARQWESTWGLCVVSPSGRWPVLLRQADLFVHPSMFDGFPRSLAEACCVGLPAVVFDEAGIPEVSEVAWKVESNQPAMIAEYVDAMLGGTRGLTGEEQRRVVGQNMRAEALRKTEQHRGDYAKLLLEVLED